jgi:vacuolar-type H+-ATPase subunit F/Vma7
MLLGQLYHYDKFLDTLESQNNIEQLQKTEILSLDLNSNDFKGLDLSQLTQELRNQFSFSFGKVLEENNLNFANQFWKSVTSPFSSQENKISQSSEFQQKLSQWEKTSLDLEDLRMILKDGKYSTDVEDFALYYGLRVVYILSKFGQKNQENNFKPTSKNLTEATAVNDNPEIVVICDSFEAPLFINLNCQFLPILEDHKLVLENLQKTLMANPEIKLVIIESLDSQDLIKILQRNIDSNILVTALDLKTKNNSEKTFFDHLVKKTLGIRLPESK